MRKRGGVWRESERSREGERWCEVDHYTERGRMGERET